MGSCDRVCVRGCTVRGEHWASCPDYGKLDGDCPGCVPAEARDGALVCERCYRRLRRLLEDAPDIVGHLRSRADPSKATAIGKTGSGGIRPEPPAPVDVDLVDASDDIMRFLREWALHLQFGVGHPWRARGLEPGIAADDAHEDALGCANLILEQLDRIANNHDDVLALAAGVLERSPGREPGFWTVADAAARWPLADQARWADRPCPDCDLRSIRVQPAGRRPARYWCTTPKCGWEANARDDDGLWGDVFAPVPKQPEPRPHDPTLLTTAEAARLVRRSTGTVRGWVTAGDLDRIDGRLREADVLRVAARKRGEA